MGNKGRHERTTQWVDLGMGSHVVRVVVINRTHQGNPAGFYCTVHPPRDAKGRRGRLVFTDRESSKYHVNLLDRQAAANLAAQWYCQGKVGQEGRCGLHYLTPLYPDAQGHDIEINATVMVTADHPHRGLTYKVLGWALSEGLIHLEAAGGGIVSINHMYLEVQA